MQRRGFTLIELLVTLAIMAALASVALPLTQVASQRARENELKRALWQIRDALDAYKSASDAGRVDRPVDGSGYPPSLEILVQGAVETTSSDRRRLYFLRRIPRDPMCDCPSRSDAETWGKRSYASPHDAPEEGDDVYDVYSLSKGVGLNGTEYGTW